MWGKISIVLIMFVGGGYFAPPVLPKRSTNKDTTDYLCIPVVAGASTNDFAVDLGRNCEERTLLEKYAVLFSYNSYLAIPNFPNHQIKIIYPYNVNYPWQAKSLYAIFNAPLAHEVILTGSNKQIDLPQKYELKRSEMWTNILYKVETALKKPQADVSKLPILICFIDRQDSSANEALKEFNECRASLNKEKLKAACEQLREVCLKIDSPDKTIAKIKAFIEEQNKENEQFTAGLKEVLPEKSLKLEYNVKWDEINNAKHTKIFWQLKHKLLSGMKFDKNDSEQYEPKTLAIVNQIQESSSRDKIIAELSSILQSKSAELKTLENSAKQKKDAGKNFDAESKKISEHQTEIKKINTLRSNIEAYMGENFRKLTTLLQAKTCLVCLEPK